MLLQADILDRIKNGLALIIVALQRGGFTVPLFMYTKYLSAFKLHQVVYCNMEIKKVLAATAIMVLQILVVHAQQRMVYAYPLPEWDTTLT